MNPDFNTMPANNIPPEAAFGLMAVLGGMLIFVLIFALAMYIYMGICLMKIAQKTNTENAWFAWVPVLNVILMLRIAKMSSWLALIMIGYIIPFINFIFIIAFMIILVIAWMKISERLGKPNWLGILMIVPIANLIIPGYLAFSDSSVSNSQQDPMQQPPMNPVQ